MIRLLSLFSGIGAFEKALENLEEPFEIIRYCEIDRYASKAYSLIHDVDEKLNLKDVCRINTEELPEDIDLVTYGFPCQDISNAGKQKGFADDNGNLTRSGLFFEALRIIEDTQPKIAIAENVKALVGKKFKAEFKIVLDSLNDAGYKNYWAVLNAKDYGIPQNRERVFIISIRDDIDHGFQFPEKYELKLRLKDLLEDSVDEKFYLSDKMILGFLKHNLNHEEKGTGFKWKPKTGNDIANCLRANAALAPTDNTVVETVILKNQAKDFRKTDVATTLMARDYKGINNYGTNAVIETLKPQRLFNIYGEGKGTSFAGNVWDKNGLSPTLMTAQGGNRQPLIIDAFLPIKEATKKGYKEAHEGDYINLQYPNSQTRRGRVGEQCANTLLCNDAQGVVVVKKENYEQLSFDDVMVYDDEIDCAGLDDWSRLLTFLRIRKLTPKECFRLMGFDDEDCDILVRNKISNSQLYKMAGNSIVVDVLEEIFVELLNQYEDVFPMG